MSLAPETRPRHSPSNSRMSWRFAIPLILLVCADFPVAAQFGSPYPGSGGVGGYPGGVGYPGGSIGGLPIPGRRRTNQNVATETLTGKLRRVSTSEFVLDPGDDRSITVSIERTTKFFTVSGGNGRLGDFDIGDQVSIDASRDNQNYYHALRVTMQQKASSSDKDAEQGSAPSTTSSNDDPDRPRLKRAPSASSSDSARDAPRAQIATADPTVEPTLKPVPRESDDPGPPKLRRGAPARVDNTPPAGVEGDTVASARPSIKAEDMNGVTRRPDAPLVGPAEARENVVSRQPTSSDPVIQGARDAAECSPKLCPITW